MQNHKMCLWNSANKKWKWEENAPKIVYMDALDHINTQHL